MSTRNWSRVRARRLLDSLIKEHGYPRPIILSESSKMTWTLGMSYDRIPPRIVLSSYLTDEELDDTLRHEFAHLLAGGRNGHNEVWKRACIQVGARPVRCAEKPMEHGFRSRNTYSYEFICGMCNQTSRKRRYRPNKYQYSCPNCENVFGTHDRDLIYQVHSTKGYIRVL